MQIKKILLIFTSWIICINLTQGQQLDHVQGEILVQFQEGVRAQTWLQQKPYLRSQQAALRIDRCVSENMKVWSLRFNWQDFSELEMLQRLRQDPNILNAQFNHFVELRSATPNDPFYGQQYFLNNTGQKAGFIEGIDLGMEEAWDITTGGVTLEGDTIVICVIDNGLDIDHEDFEGNVWINHNEIPNNGMDDDNNGYVDDYRGWHVANGNDNIDDQNWHGTLTAGIIGAKGNNGIGVTGINWDVKLMIIVGGFGQAVESRIIEAYDYCLTQRKLYNETDGDKGAFVVASNSSWGVAVSFPEEYPLWCAVYDSLGKEGIINIAATDNKNVNVDEDGDMPTSCTSDFLISVTNVGGDGKKINAAGFGANSIDLGAFGDQVYTTGNGNIYTEDGGTSFAAPMVTGAVGLLYAANCASLSAIYTQSPEDAALKIKDLILRGVDPEPTLDGITLTGGRLNIYNSLQILIDECGDCPPLLQVRTEQLLDTSTDIKWIDNELITQVDFRWRQKEASEWTTQENVSSPISLNTLQACTNYEYQFQVYCSNDTIPFDDRTFSFKTDGCCDPPSTSRVTFVGQSSVALSWEAIFAAESYTVRYRELGAETWIERFSPSTSRSIQQLASCTSYEIQIRTNCNGEDSAFGETINVTTMGCGACIDEDYCSPNVEPIRSDSEWISEVRISGFNNASNGQGYSDFTDLESTTLNIGDTARLYLKPGFSGFAFDEFFKVWIDFDQDGFFSSNDVVFESPNAGKNPVDTVIQIPNNAMAGKTRMRVIMKFNAEPSACIGDINSFFGEVEDYCINIGQATSTKNLLPQNASMQVFPNPVSHNLSIRLRLNETIERGTLEVINTQGQIVWQDALPKLNKGNISRELSTQNWAPGVYFMRLRTKNGFLFQKIIKSLE